MKNDVTLDTARDALMGLRAQVPATDLARAHVSQGAFCDEQALADQLRIKSSQHLGCEYVLLHCLEQRHCVRMVMYL